MTKQYRILQATSNRQLGRWVVVEVSLSGAPSVAVAHCKDLNQASMFIKLLNRRSAAQSKGN